MKKNDLRIFIAEDEFIISFFIETILRDAKYQVVGTASRGEELLKKHRLIKPNLILMDIGLAGRISGIETALQIVQKTESSVIFMTGNSDLVATDPRIKKIKPLASWIKPIDENHILNSMNILFPD